MGQTPYTSIDVTACRVDSGFGRKGLRNRVILRKSVLEMVWRIFGQRSELVKA